MFVSSYLLAFSLIGCPGIGPMACLDNNRQLSIIAMVHVSNWSKQWHCFEFLKLFFHSVFSVFFVGNGASNASQLSRNKLQEEGGTGGMFNRSIIQYFFTTKLSYEIVEEFFIT